MKMVWKKVSQDEWRCGQYRITREWSVAGRWTGAQFTAAWEPEDGSECVVLGRKTWMLSDAKHACEKHVEGRAQT